MSVMRNGRIHAEWRVRVNNPDGRAPTSQTAGPSLAIAYVPSQTFGELYTSSEALGRGTLFKELYMPYGGGPKCGRI